jgi:hypothetical protein
MLWDIALPVLAAAAQGLTGFLGWRVTVDGVQPDRKKLYEWLFALATLAGIVSIGIAAYRGSQISRDLADLKNGQQATNIGLQAIQHNPPSVTVNPQINIPASPAPKEHTRVNWLTGNPIDPLLPFHKDEIPTRNVGFTNGGDFPIRDWKAKVAIVVVPFGESSTVFRTYQNILNATLMVPGGVLNPHAGEIRYHTVSGPALSEEDVSKLDDGEKALCVIGMVKWKDDSGSYKTDLLQCFVAEPPHPQGGFNWHINIENDAEHKLQ